MEETTVTKEQIGYMRHALGLKKSDIPTRNFFEAGSNNIEDWKDLVGKGLAEIMPENGIAQNVFYVSQAGMDLLGVVKI
ncbi:hypothetical protein HCJ70_16270 [Listeria booriae]|uniref:hypothetical protein n=1 Tax=Listeria booriae TaxID=1552123 RepID=UPI0016256FA9|nr:hypothetical protein [Listeria booriae]MBC2100608.1 hypothetical protein [Listeria booriae]